MPQLSDLIKKRAKKKFIKKEYRSWDLSGTGIVDNPPDIIETGISAEKEALSTCPKETIVPIDSGNVTDNNLDNISDNKQITNDMKFAILHVIE